MFSTSSGKVSRVGFMVRQGYFNPDYTPEDLRDNLDTVRSFDNYLDPSETNDELAIILPAVQEVTAGITVPDLKEKIYVAVQ